MTSQAFSILVVPGHDNQYSGAKFRTIREADITLILANKIAKNFKKISGVEVSVTRSRNGYSPILVTYFKKNRNSVKKYVQEKKTAITQLAQSSGDVISPTMLPHANANAEVAYRLFAMNKWANEKKFDMVLHIHFNDNYPRSLNSRGPYSGYTVYAPGDGLPNKENSIPIANSLAKYLVTSFHPSTMPLEAKNSSKEGVALDNKLIALGAYGTSNIPTVLVEYGYIYEPALTGKSFNKTTDLMAKDTVFGIENYMATLK
jgi:N-acetylmuramoyl-L-alanine amidase